MNAVQLIVQSGWCSRLLGGLLLLGLLGCGQGPAQPEDTGSREVVQKFFEALLKEDWPTAHALLHLDSQKHYPLNRFTDLARSYHRQLGFASAQVYVRSCEERGPEATAHVNIVGLTANQKRRRYEDGILLRRDQSQWRVVLPKTFGRRR